MDFLFIFIWMGIDPVTYLKLDSKVPHWCYMHEISRGVINFEIEYTYIQRMMTDTVQTKPF